MRPARELSPMTIHERIDQLDLALFQTIEGQSSEGDRRSFLALQSACRQWKQGGFTVLEIGSFEGGSLQGYVADPSCERIVSVDPRPPSVPDERGSQWDYSQVTAEQMLTRLAAVPGADVGKVQAITASTETLSADDLDVRPDLCFIDGEHTDEAVLRDARFCLAVAAPDCVIAFHDAHIVYRGLQELLGELEKQGRRFRAYNLPSVVFVIELGECRLSGYEPLRSLREQNYLGYLDSLLKNDPFRETARRFQRLTRQPMLGLARRLGVVAVAKKLFDLR